MVLARSDNGTTENEGQSREERRLRREEAQRVQEEQRAEEERAQAERAQAERAQAERAQEEEQRILDERHRRLSVDPPASPSEQPAPLKISNKNIATREYRGDVSPPRSQRTTNATLRLRVAELEAAKQLAELKRKEMELEADLIKKRLAVQQATIEEDDGPEEAGPSRKVNDWLQNTPQPQQRRSERPPEDERAWERRERSRTPGRAKNAIEQLAEAFEKMTRPQRRYNSDLPTFTGAQGDWLAFKAAMRDSTRLYGIPPTENLLRLRICLKGEARDAVSSLLHSATDPDIIMATLEQNFGQPESIIDRALDDVRKLPKPGVAATELNSFATKVQNLVHTVQSLDCPEYLHNPLMVREVLSKLCPSTRQRWRDYAYDHSATSEAKVVLLSRFLMREANIALRYDYTPATAAGTSSTQRATTSNTGAKKRTTVYATEDIESPHCEQCDGAHTNTKCRQYLALSVPKRWDLVREKGLCFKCVDSKHRRFTCRAKMCGVKQCRRPHHATLHEDNETTRPTPAPPTRTVTNKEEGDAVVLSVDTNAANTVLLKVCPVVVSGPHGEMNTYALLDEGATVSLIDEELANHVGANGPTRPLHMSGVNMSQSERDSREVEVYIRGKSENALFQLKGRTIRDLSLRRQTLPEDILRYRHLSSLRPEEVCYERARPLILVGADHWELIVSRELRMGGPDLPAASKTQLGWVVHGTAPRSAIMKTSENVLHIYTPDQRVHNQEEHERHLEKLVESHFAVESLGIAPKPRESNADQRARAIFNDTIKKIEEGYEVGLPWRHEHVTAPPSYAAAANRLRSLEKKMDADPTFAAVYEGQVNRLLEKKYAAPCDGSEVTSDVCWYLPHFAVENPNKPGKKRLVFDAAHRNQGVCLNDLLLEGPDLLQSLPGILFRFRERKIAVIADVQEMFLQVKIRPEDQPAQQFLWRGADRTGPPRAYKMTSMIFGAASSPFIAHSVRDHNAHAHAATHPRALVAITRNHYMDDYADSYDDTDEALRTIAEVQEVHKAAGFTLRGWCSNNTEALSNVPTSLRATGLTQLGGAEADKILGLYWHADTDELAFNTAMKRINPEVRDLRRAPTKREALSVVMSVYDPLGLLSQYTVRAKIILQNLWRLQIPWDDPLPEEEAEHFAAWLQLLRGITSLRIPRCYGLDGARRLELHVMCDASEQAYATVAYWRGTRHDGSITVALVAAKAKVAPKRTLSIPRLELQAAVIGARLADTIKKEHRFEPARTVYWTDSATVVHWVKNDSRRYTPFVAHRLGEIAELSHRDEWRWLPTGDNVADDATRLQGTPIDAHDRWFTGPSFLLSPEAEWPSQRIIRDDDEQEVLHTSVREHTTTQWTPDPARFSKYERLVRATAYVLLFTEVCRRRATHLEHRHIERAERALLQRAQEDSYADELRRLEAGRPISRSSRLYKLDPVVEDGLLRVRGRINAADAPADAKKPIILDGRHPITRLLVLREHCRAGHANRERVTNDLRQLYWVVHLRPTVRAVEHHCALCRVRKARPHVPSTGDLPRARVDPFHRPFTNCGLDFFGPMTVKIGRRREKRWGALFTCLTTRAVHLELVDSLTTDSAIMAMRRMAARRGWPRHMYSDNATNFKGADQELRRAYEEWAPGLREEGLLHRMQWTYIPPGAPNQGGAWERLVRSVKTALAATLREKVTTPEILSTLLTEAEHSVNGRPLTHVSVSPRDPEALTPNHFLLGSSTGLPTTGPCDEADRRTWRATEALADSFWRRWIREYLPTLVPRGEPTSVSNQLRVGDIVVVVDSTMPRNVWPIGRVEATHPGPDGGIRVAEVKTRTGTFRRPTSKIAVLVQAEEASQATPGGGC